ncbi:MAG TPA: hypothetical protein DIS53_01735 [Candidatus Wildermuthbacteria bacterium]|nr:MAG: hypothetical protein UY25_C0001G0095 [Candidatus Yanofskybacteria bacterium GW2011_GWC1_48_11]KKW03930.1 MAG: hypothetical protein UY38_C0002G0084 [Parcubacteria group bacterium GW2011_GWB1_49_12]OHA69492.1 MAG: hypothetical protein A3D63_02735 [Candidatus Wildermuthbacteria bacterium RIFCSPHIGHO2_02_FULL_49_17]OHA78456.1 MAG: hypothetical protein A3G10_02070 [Candidatus Wildermuthbacteria bacterium RIFCSPLOWO2_12_FULL_49_9]HCM36639.1 hypothetical protein [Candidatus Wildermuthbacteria 
MPTQQYNQEEMWKIFEKLPEELKEAVFSAENAEHTFSICERHEINECPQVASLIGLVLMGVMLPRDFEVALVKDLGLGSATAQQVAQEVNRFILYPVKDHLEAIHAKPAEKGNAVADIGIATPRHSDRILTEESYIVTPGEEEKPSAAEEAEEQKGPDQYREPIE